MSITNERKTGQHTSRPPTASNNVKKPSLTSSPGSRAASTSVPQVELLLRPVADLGHSLLAAAMNCSVMSVVTTAALVIFGGGGASLSMSYGSWLRLRPLKSAPR